MSVPTYTECMNHGKIENVHDVLIPGVVIHKSRGIYHSEKSEMVYKYQTLFFDTDANSIGPFTVHQATSLSSLWEIHPDFI